MEETETMEWMEYQLRLIDIEKSLIDNDYLLPTIEKNYLECVKTWLQIESFIPNRVQTPLVKRIIRILETFFYKVLQKAKLSPSISEVRSTIEGNQYDGNHSNQVSPRVSRLKCTFMEQSKYDQLSEIDRTYSGQGSLGARLCPSISLYEQNQLKSQLDSRIKSFNIQSTIMELGQIQYSFQSSKNQLVYFLNNIQNHVRRVKKIEIQHSIGGELKIMKDEKDAVMHTYEKKLNDLAIKVKAQLTDSNNRVLALKNQIKLLNPETRHSSTQTTNQYVLDLQALKRKDVELNQEKDRLKKLIESYDSRSKEMEKMEECRLDIQTSRNKIHTFQNTHNYLNEVKVIMGESKRSPQILGLISNIQLMEDVIGKQSITRLSKQSKIIVTSKLDGLIKSINDSPTDEGGPIRSAQEQNQENNKQHNSFNIHNQKLPVVNNTSGGTIRQGEKSKKTIMPIVNSVVKRPTKRSTQKQSLQVPQTLKKSDIPKNTTINMTQTAVSSNLDVNSTLEQLNPNKSPSKCCDVEQYPTLKQEKQTDNPYTYVEFAPKTEELNNEAISSITKLPQIMSRGQVRLQTFTQAQIQQTKIQHRIDTIVQTEKKLQIQNQMQVQVELKVQMRATNQTKQQIQLKFQNGNLEPSKPSPSPNRFTNQKSSIDKHVASKHEENQPKNKQSEHVAKNIKGCDSISVSGCLGDHPQLQHQILSPNALTESMRNNNLIKLMVQKHNQIQKSSNAQQALWEEGQRQQLRGVGCQIAIQTDAQFTSSVAIQTETQDFCALQQSQNTAKKMSDLTYDTSFFSQKTSIMNLKKTRQQWKSAFQSASDIKMQLQESLPNISEFCSRKQSNIHMELDSKVKDLKQFKTPVLTNKQTVRKVQRETGPNLKQLLIRNMSLRSPNRMDTHVKAMHLLQEYNIDQHLDIPQLVEKLRQRQDRQDQKWNYHLAKVCDKIKNLGPQYLKKRRLFQSQSQIINQSSSQKS